MKRRSPIQHPVREHTREGKPVRDYERGSGVKRQRKSRVVGHSKQTIQLSRSDIQNISKFAKQSSINEKEYVTVITLDNGHGIIGDWSESMAHHISNELLKAVGNQFMLHTHPDTPPEYVGQYESASPSFGDLYQHTIRDQHIFGIASHEQGVVKFYFLNPSRRVEAMKYAKKWQGYIDGAMGVKLDDTFDDEMEEYLRSAWTSIPPKVYSLRLGGDK